LHGAVSFRKQLAFASIDFLPKYLGLFLGLRATPLQFGLALIELLLQRGKLLGKRRFDFSQALVELGLSRRRLLTQALSFLRGQALLFQELLPQANHLRFPPRCEFTDLFGLFLGLPATPVQFVLASIELLP